ncbi:hypothetical protein C2G38_2283386 [Gigaspora rosea]|uniref:Acyltransferase 3 domain-containing protein n=1 Tax=Gigaspora rosea TaxID=44941 RepID=A0A397U337_9GLOM|nr:hypothetical protein C2G38_2283386 [Gigaspora rosea]
MPDSKPKQPIFHAAFLDGIRGIAALAIVYEHSQKYYKQSLTFDMFNLAGQLGIEIPSTKTKYNICYKFLSYVQLKIWINCQIAMKLWLKFFLRRFMRIYPPYAILLPVIAYNDFVKRAYYSQIHPSNLGSHLFLQTAEFTFWTIPPEMKYYLCIPIIVIGYVELTRFGAYLTSCLFGKPEIGAWICRILGNIILLAKWEELYLIYRDAQNTTLVSNAHIFLTGSICSIWYREIIRLGLLPLSSKEEKTLVGKSNDSDEDILKNSSSMKQIINKFPSRHKLTRLCYDFGYYITLFIILCTFPHLSEKVFGMPRDTLNLNLEKSFGGSLYAILILGGLLSCDSSFVNACSCNFLRFCGRVSFSIYLLHPIPLTFVSKYLT